MPFRIFDAADNFLEATATFCEVLQKASKIAEAKVNTLEKVTQIETEVADEIAILEAHVKLVECKRRAANVQLLKENQSEDSTDTAAS